MVKPNLGMWLDMTRDQYNLKTEMKLHPVCLQVNIRMKGQRWLIEVVTRVMHFVTYSSACNHLSVDMLCKHRLKEEPRNATV